MSKHVINSFNAGELSPYLYARTDLDKYSSGCLTMENFMPLPYGGATRRPALEQLGESLNNDKVRLIPFVPRTDASYVVELGTEYMRAWKSDGTLITMDSMPETPYSDTDLVALKHAQSVDVMWVVHPDYFAQRVSRISETEWRVEPESFDYPPLMEENDTEITMSPSATTGTITIESSQDFFDSGHVGAYMVFKSIRNLANKIVSEEMTATKISASINVSASDWEFETRGDWEGRIVIQRSLDGGTNWEDYIAVADTSVGGTTSAEQKNFTVSSSEPEPFNASLRVSFQKAATTSGHYEIKVSNPFIESLVKITGYTSATSVTAEVIGDFQDVATGLDTTNYTDYPIHDSGNAYVVGETCRVDSSLTYASDNPNLESVVADATNAVGCDYGSSKLWVVTDDGADTVQNIHEISDLGGTETLDNTYDISGDFTRVYDIAWHSNEIYVLGNAGGGQQVKRYSEAGVLQETYGITPNQNTYVGLGYGEGFFWLGRADANGIYKFTTTFVYTGYRKTTSANEQMDICYASGFLFVANKNDNTIDKWTTSFLLEDSTSISGQTTSVTGICYDGESIWAMGDDGSSVMRIFKYTLEPQTKYYQCISATTAGAFADQYLDGEWSERTPVMKTWTEGAFSDYRGHPQAVALFENRLCYAGTATNPDTVWMSVIDDYQNFRLGSLDTDGLQLTLNSGRVDEIRWLVPQENLIIGTAGSEWALGAANESEPVTPTAFNLKRKTTYGTGDVQAILVNSAVLFLMRQGRKVREWTNQFDPKDNTAPDLSILAEHITEGGVSLWDFQQQPDNVLWSIRNDGTLLGFTYERDQNVTGWHRHTLEDGSGEFESIAVIPRDGEEDEVWVSVKLTVDGGTKRYVARFDDREWGTDYTTEWRGSDLYTVYTSPGTATLTGLDYLEGKTVDVVADGAVKDTETVTSGSVTIDSDAYTTVVVGLHYKSTLAPIYIEQESQFGTTHGSQRNIRTGTLRFKDTFSAEAGQNLSQLEDVRFEQDDSPLYNGEREVYFDNSSDFLHTCYVVQDDPMPCTVVAMIPKIEVRK